ncbi:hypothetical protein F4826_004744 [Rahnella inusitata]|nr:hypothetical protein [Rahnella inusitata]
MQTTLKTGFYDTDMYHEVAPDAFFDHLGGVKPAAHCRWFWYRNENPDERHSYLPCGQTRRKRSTIDNLIDLRARVPGLINQYFTPNVFFDWRKKALLAGFCTNYVEIDTTIERGLRPDECEKVMREVFSQLSIANIPMPTAVVESGSGGLHLYWAYDMLDAYPARQQTWVKMAHALTSSLSGGELWKVDMAASHDMTRFLRVPGSIHGETVRDVRAFLSLGNVILSFDQLAEKLGVRSVDQRINPQAVSNDPSWSKSNKTAPSGHHSISAWWLRIFWHLNQYVREQGHLKQGQRDSVAFIMFVALRRTVSLSKAWERIKEINKHHIGLGEKELEQYLSTASKVHYRYRKSTLVEYFKGADVPVPDFLIGETISWKQSKGLSGEEIKRRQAAAGKKTSIKRRAGSYDRLIKAVKQGITNVKELAVQCGVSIRTVQRHRSAVLATFASLVYPPPPG